MSHVQGFDSMDEMYAAMAASEDAANANLFPGQIRARDAVTETIYWAQVVKDWDMIVYGQTPPIAVTQAGADFDVKDNRERGYLTGTAYSQVEPGGEGGDTHVSQIVPITAEVFALAEAGGWPSFSEVRTNETYRYLLMYLSLAERSMRS